MLILVLEVLLFSFENLPQSLSQSVLVPFTSLLLLKSQLSVVESQRHSLSNLRVVSLVVIENAALAEAMHKVFLGLFVLLAVCIKVSHSLRQPLLPYLPFMETAEEWLDFGAYELDERVGSDIFVGVEIVLEAPQPLHYF